MKDQDVHTQLENLPGDPAREAFRQQVLQDSTAEFVRVQRQRSAWRKARWAMAAGLMISGAFLAGRLSAPAGLPETRDITPLANAASNSTTVSTELIAWLDAARLFGQLGMEDRMARAVERAGRLLPAETVSANYRTGPMFADAGHAKQQVTPPKPTDHTGPHLSDETITQILAFTLGE